MAHSIQTAGERYEVMEDLDLLILLGMLAEEIDQRPQEYPELSALCRIWEKSRRAYGPWPWTK